jgi:transcriptional regulator with XRE-family HTH domain
MGATTIGSALAERRRELSLEKGQAAKQIGMSRTTYSSYEQDAQRPSTEVFTALAEFLGISVEQFLPLYGATCVAQARVSLGRVAPQVQRSNEPLNEPPRSLDHGAATAETVPDTSSSSEPEPTTKVAAPEPATPEPEELNEPEQLNEPEVVSEVAEVEDTPEPSEGDEAEQTGAPEPATPTPRASFDDRNLSWPSSSNKNSGQKKKKKKKKGKKG